PESYVAPSVFVYGNASRGTKFLWRTATGSSFSSRAAASTVRSINSTDSGRPAPRYGPVPTVLVTTPKISTAALAIAEQPGDCVSGLPGGPTAAGCRYAPRLP